MREVKLLYPPMRINTFGGQVSLGTKFGKLQINTRAKDGNKMPLGMRIILTAGTGLYSTPRAEKPDCTRISSPKHVWGMKTARYHSTKTLQNAEYIGTQQSPRDHQTTSQSLSRKITKEKSPARHARSQPPIQGANLNTITQERRTQSKLWRDLERNHWGLWSHPKQAYRRWNVPQRNHQSPSPRASSDQTTHITENLQVKPRGSRSSLNQLPIYPSDV